MSRPLRSGFQPHLFIDNQDQIRSKISSSSSLNWGFYKLDDREMVELLYGFTALHLVVFFLTLRILYKHIIHPVLISPLRKVPNAHWSVGFSSWWILWTRYRSRELATIHESHKRHGPVIRLAPNEISVNCVKGGIQTIYAGGFEKHEWYSNLFDNYGYVLVHDSSCFVLFEVGFTALVDMDLFSIIVTEQFRS